MYKANKIKDSLRMSYTISKSGSVTPSSKRLALKMISQIDFNKTKLIVELGAGNGCITKYILQKMSKDSILIVFEVDPKMIEILKGIEDHRLIVVNDSAENITTHITKAGKTKADAIISCLPITILPKNLVNNILQKCTEVLGDTGRYVQFQYSPRTFKMLKKYFDILRKDLVLMNIPPAFVMHCSVKKDI
ncbi:class I SAM-dependent methyltransferase [Ichthyobacterium seriolicida]|uniref:Ribosomal RNA adenine dimethylase n=1 Tax=Ichthyobacterium seriolicida TaxID=242600 RepID=A0A1J1ED73_9FLAO|nr:rRNA adenine N-6-methyltransferase family protein [Ichthyobacterium seriolicida]BAV95472.1 ribosomal RNA adenine dimethylase [Ichthyobacterium seriolicida]